MPVQLLFAVRLADGAVPPDDIVASIAGGGTITYRRSASYEAQLQQFEPAPAGQRWWGWLSDQANYGRKTGQAVSISLQVTLPRPPDGGPLPSPLPWRPVVGGRQIDTGIPVSRPVNCGQTRADFYDGYSEVGMATDTISCVSSPDAAATRTDLGAPLVDFGATGTSVKGPAGSSVTATTRSAGALTRRRLPAGTSTIAFSGRVGRKALAAGSYRLVLRAVDPAGNRSALTTLPFAVVAR